jgi:hypothetical protein
MLSRRQHISGISHTFTLDHWHVTLSATNRSSDESRTTATALKISFYIFDDVTSPEYGILSITSSFSAAYSPLQELREKYSDRYCLSMQTTGSQSCDIDWLFFALTDKMH